MDQLKQGFLLTRHWRDTAAGAEVEFWLATGEGARSTEVIDDQPPARAVRRIVASAAEAR